MLCGVRCCEGLNPPAVEDVTCIPRLCEGLEECGRALSREMSGYTDNKDLGPFKAEADG